jgi:hypothetical protein
VKAITLIQPWATLVAIGAKTIETRSWRTEYSGPLAIHAAKTMPAWAKDLCVTEPFLSALLGVKLAGNNPVPMIGDFPLGCVVATCELVGVVPANVRWSAGGARFKLPPDEPELSFGDYSPGRFAWLLASIKPLPEPIPARGALGLWDWKEG